MSKLFDNSVRADALTVGCRYCSAPIGEPCTNRAYNNAPLQHFIAHLIRQKDAREKADDGIPF